LSGLGDITGGLLRLNNNQNNSQLYDRSPGRSNNRMTGKEFTPPVILASQPRLRLCFIYLITDSAGTNLLGFGRETIRDV